MAVVGSGLGGDCAPKEANYRRFFDACSSPAWEVVLRVSSSPGCVQCTSLLRVTHPFVSWPLKSARMLATSNSWTADHCFTARCVRKAAHQTMRWVLAVLPSSM